MVLVVVGQLGCVGVCWFVIVCGLCVVVGLGSVLV